MKLTPCDPSQSCFTSCSELVHSRFLVTDVGNLGFSGLEVTEVIRVENRLLFNRCVLRLRGCLNYWTLIFVHTALMTS